MAKFFDHKTQHCWTVTLDCIQEADDGKDSTDENHFMLQMCSSPGGGWFIRVKGEVALDLDEFPLLRAELQKIADILGWKNA